MKKSLFPIIMVSVLVIAGLFTWGKISPGPLDEFAQCLEDNGAVFYGAFWCENCNDQKRLFGNSAKKLPYVECSPQNKQGQFQVCLDAGIQGYPTWDFNDGSREVGVMELSELAQRTGCALPE
jgi:thiol-disulfide isomerase/thioredoxin